MPINLIHLETAARFECLCQALLAEEFPRFQPFSQPDLGMDGYDSTSETVFQVYFPEKAPRRDKIAADLAKARIQGWPCKRWVLLLPKNPTPILLSWLAREREALPFDIEVWGHTSICKLLRKHPAIQNEFFPTELQREIGRILKGKKPKPGDAAPGKTVSHEQAAEIKQDIDKIVEEEARRKKRAPKSADYAREFGEFNAHFVLSSYDRLAASEFFAAREYLERKRYGRRTANTNSQQRNTYIAGIKAIQKDLKIADSAYRTMLLNLAGSSSTTRMELDVLRMVFHHFKQMQGRAAVNRADC